MKRAPRTAQNAFWYLQICDTTTGRSARTHRCSHGGQLQTQICPCNNLPELPGTPSYCTTLGRT
eukprot:6374430-Lingulodinium_polyedra.AAC.1